MSAASRTAPGRQGRGRPLRPRHGGLRLSTLLAALTGLLWLAGCGSAPDVPPAEVPDGDPGRGLVAIERYGCGACHGIPGIRGADATVGPPLDRWGDRAYIAGNLPNTGPNLQRWLRDPQEVEPGTAMPDMGVTAIDARDIAAYLLTLD